MSNECNRELFYEQMGGKNALITVETAFNMLMALSTENETKKSYCRGIDNFQEWLKGQIVGINDKTKEIMIVRDERWDLAVDVYKKEVLK